MPFRSRAQMRKFAALEQQGKLPPGTFRRWYNETPNPRELPEHIRQTRKRRKPKRTR